MTRFSEIASDRRFRWCLALSAVLTSVALSLLGLMLTPRPLPTPPATPRLMRVAFLPTPPPPPRPVVVRRVPPRPVKKTPPRRVLVKRPVIVRPRPRVVPKVQHLRATLRRASARRNPLVAKRPALPGGAASPAPTVPTPAASPPVMTVQNSRLIVPHVPPAPVDLPTVAPAPASDNSGGSGTAGAGSGPGVGTGGGPFGIGSGGPGDGEGPRHVVYVLDISGSMTSRIDRARQELQSSLASLKRGETFDIVTFNDQVHFFSNQMEPATPFMVARADFFLSTLQVSEGTNIELALRDTLQMPSVNVVFVITDGVPTMDAFGGDINTERYMKYLPSLVSTLNIHRARIYTIGLVGKDPNGQDESFAAAGMLQEIARDSGGVSKIVPLGVAAP